MQRLQFNRLVRPYWKLLAVAFVATLVESAADLLEPWPLKVIFDYVIGSKPMPGWLARWPVIGHDRLALLNAAALAVDRHRRRGRRSARTARSTCRPPSASA